MIWEQGYTDFILESGPEPAHVAFKQDIMYSSAAVSEASQFARVCATLFVHQPGSV